jgi:hypothetical protein
LRFKERTGITLTSFLEQRLREEEALIAAWMEVLWYEPPVFDLDVPGDGERFAHGFAEYAASVLFTPSRFAAECEAKRTLLDIHWNGRVRCKHGFEHGFTDECPSIKPLVLPYVDHPDFRDEWLLNEEPEEEDDL